MIHVKSRYSKGQRIGGRYYVKDVMMGGMREVYLCLDEDSLSPVALKTFQTNRVELRIFF